MTSTVDVPKFFEAVSYNTRFCHSRTGYQKALRAIAEQGAQG